MKRIAFFIPTLHGGGAERVTLNLLNGMLGLNVSLDLVIASAEGPYLNNIPKQVRVVNLEVGRVIKALLPLSRYLQQHKPCALVSHMSHANVVAVLAKRLARTKTKLVLVEHNTLSVEQSKLFRARFVPMFMKWLYPNADAIVGVSKGVAEDLQVQLGLAAGKVGVIYNPVVDNELLKKAKAPLDHPWFQEGAPPVFLAVGRLTEQKDFPTLIQAFALLRKQRLARLLILGEGECRTELERMIHLLGIADDVSLPGFVENPYAYMFNASAFILSSRWEGLPTVLIEAMACGSPVISTDCPSGPKEILEAGKYGNLVSVGDTAELSKAMLKVLDAPVNRDFSVKQAMNFSVEQAASKYLALVGYT
ncbi:glycosyltransferase [Scytonema hofmannii PCC 7110]|uniref:Glycosyltransferase n=1 Tax=Scytonema hofmannii PCC 7110 TaxID=128403 RepID=A0A139X642_9CYAN|nr:glycosyltransferase [Scytonema hofmannii]KYC40126.1 glycosyltransferase [Scytonema hofmannii PCC 7110]